jgi:hypothetical protein
MMTMQMSLSRLLALVVLALVVVLVVVQFGPAVLGGK